MAMQRTIVRVVQHLCPPAPLQLPQFWHLPELHGCVLLLLVLLHALLALPCPQCWEGSWTQAGHGGTQVEAGEAAQLQHGRMLLLLLLLLLLLMMMMVALMKELQHQNAHAQHQQWQRKEYL